MRTNASRGPFHKRCFGSSIQPGDFAKAYSVSTLLVADQSSDGRHNGGRRGQQDLGTCKVRKLLFPVTEQLTR